MIANERAVACRRLLQAAVIACATAAATGCCRVAAPREEVLGPGQTASAIVHACAWETPTAIVLERGGRYRFDVEGAQTWRDWTIECGADGWTGGGLIEWARGLRRAPGEDLFVLIGRVDGVGGRDFAIGRQRWVTAPASGRLLCYANDVKFMYWNNGGTVRLTVRRLE